MILTYGRTLNEKSNIIGRILRRGNHAVHPDLHLLFLNLYYSETIPIILKSSWHPKYSILWHCLML